MRLLSVRLMVSLMIGITARCRTHIKRYHDLLAEVEVEAEAEPISWRFQNRQVEADRIPKAVS